VVVLGCTNSRRGVCRGGLQHPPAGAAAFSSKDGGSLARLGIRKKKRHAEQMRVPDNSSFVGHLKDSKAGKIKAKRY
jgi:hypothetical protein